MSTRLPLFALVATLAAGCSAAWLPAALRDRPAARIELQAAFAGGRTVQAAVTPYATADVNHLVVKAFTVANSTETPASGAGGPVSVDVQQASLGSGIVLDGLARNTKYRLRGYAYSKAGTASADQISLDASSYVDVDVAADDRPSVATLSIQLGARTFSAQATSSLDIKAGSVTDAGGEFVAKGS